MKGAAIRLSLRFVIPLLIVLGFVAYGVLPIIESLTYQWAVRDLDIRAKLIPSTMQDSLAEMLEQRSGAKVQRFFDRVVQDERIYAIGYCDLKGRLLYRTSVWPSSVTCKNADYSALHTKIIELPDGPLHLTFWPIEDSGRAIGQLVLVQDLSYAKHRSSKTKLYVVGFISALGILISFITVVVARMSWMGWSNGLRSLLAGDGLLKPVIHLVSPELRPLVKDLRRYIRNLDSTRKAKDEDQVSWSPQTLKEILHRELSGDEVIIVSNREPYIHVKQGDRIEVQVPASGVVTALEPVMRACSGTWIAHGGGSGDREVADKHGRVRVPPEHPEYQIRRVWLTKEEEQGYYYGFSNEGLWALCHIAHVRPSFRSQDWAQYVAVNEKFAQAVVDEAKTSDPVILVQDYHFALLPKMIKKRLPKATVITFWHIPFPNPEVFGICPWRQELLDGLLSSDILGFHTQFHCSNFIDAVDRFVESRIDRERQTISHGGNFTAVNQYPISIEYPVKWIEKLKSVSECRAGIRKENGLPEDLLVGIGVDRLDYTKGILERFFSIERLLEIEPKWIGKFTFIQIAAPSRSSIKSYQDFEASVREMADRINKRFGKENYAPICLKVEHQEPSKVYEYYRGADLCFVSSLHDGMNLVAKEFIASRSDEAGVLILSQFTGASRELSEALIVNPYDIDHCAAALHAALEMPKDEQRNRVRFMRGLIQEFNVYRWAGRMLLDAARLRKRTRLFGHLAEDRFDPARFSQ